MSDDSNAGGDAQAGGGGDSTAAIDMTAQPIREAIARAVADATAGLAQKNRQLLSETKQAKEERQRLIEEFGGDAGLDELRTLRQQIEQNEELKLLKEGKIDALRDRWLSRTKADYEAQLKARDETLRAESEAKTALQQRLEREIIGNAVRMAADSIPSDRPRFVPGAVDDAVDLALRVFALDEDGRPVARDEDGQPIFGKDAKPMSVAEWIGTLPEKKPYWFPATQGGGATGGVGKGARIDLSKMEPRQRLDYARQHGLR